MQSTKCATVTLLKSIIYEILFLFLFEFLSCMSTVLPGFLFFINTTLLNFLIYFQLLWKIVHMSYFLFSFPSAECLFGFLSVLWHRILQAGPWGSSAAGDATGGAGMSDSRNSAVSGPLILQCIKRLAWKQKKNTNPRKKITKKVVK